MKPFDLEAAKNGEPICWANGDPARLIAHVPEAAIGHQLIVLNERTKVVTRHSVETNVLCMAPKKRIVWVNFYPDTSAATRGFPWGDANWHTTKEKADELASGTRIGGKAWPVEIEE